MSRIFLFLLLFMAACTQSDKANHYLVGAGVSRAVSEATGNPWAGCAAAILAGIAKEAIDSRTHAPDTYDAVATGLGGCQVSIAF